MTKYKFHGPLAHEAAPNKYTEYIIAELKKKKKSYYNGLNLDKDVQIWVRLGLLIYILAFSKSTLITQQINTQ